MPSCCQVVANLIGEFWRVFDELRRLCFKRRRQEHSAGLVFLAPELQPVLQHVHHDRALLSGSVGADALEEEVALLAVDCPGAHGQTELDIGLDLSGMGRAVEESELHCTLGKEGVEVDAMVPGVVVVAVVDSSAVSAVGAGVPDLLHGFPVLVGFLHRLEECLVDLLAPAVCSVADLEGFVEQVLSANEEVHEAGHGFRSVVRTIHMDVDPGGAVGDCPGRSQLPHDFLQVFHVIVLKDRGHDLAGVFAAGGDGSAVLLSLALDGSVAHALPGAALAVGGAVGSIVGSEVGGLCAVVLGDDLCGLLSGDAGKLNLYSIVLCLDGGCHFQSLT